MEIVYNTGDKRVVLKKENNTMKIKIEDSFGDSQEAVITDDVIRDFIGSQLHIQALVKNGK